MAKRRTKVDPINKYIKKYAAEDTVFEGRQQDLPPGINNGIARITKGDVKPYNDGNGNRVYVAATVLEPQEVTWVPKVFKDGKVQTLKPTTRKIYGSTTKQIEPLCARGKNRDGTPKTEEECIKETLEKLRLWGCNTEGVETIEDLESVIADWVEEGPCIRFRTVLRALNDKNPQEGAWENWDGVTEYDEEDADDGVVEEEEVDEEETEDTEDEEEEVEDEEDEKEEEDTEDEVEEDDDDTEEADDDDEEEEGDDDDKYEDVDIVPERYDNYYYKPPKKRKRVLCEVTAVFKGKETCNLKNTEDGKTAYRGVKWSDLYEEEE